MMSILSWLAENRIMVSRSLYGELSYQRVPKIHAAIANDNLTHYAHAACRVTLTRQ